MNYRRRTSDEVGSLLFILIILSLIDVAEGNTRELKKGPPAKVEKEVKDHLFQIYVMPPKAEKGYSPGEITVYLRREFPDYMYVPLKHAAMKDGRLHIQIAISPERETTYSITVLDKQPIGEPLLLYWKKLKDIEAPKP